MQNIQAVSVSRYGNKRWKRFTDYLFSAQDSLVGLSIQEASRAMMYMPLAFYPVGQEFMLGALLGLTPGKNLFVSTEGRWLGGYIPASYRSYPFQALRVGGGDGRVLCISEDSGLITEDVNGEPFFDENNALTKNLSDILGFLGQQVAGQEANLKACGLLKKYNLIKVWPITVQLEAGESRVQGLYCIDTQAFDQLGAEPLYELKESGALMMAYCQILSMQCLPSLERLLVAHNKAQAQSAMSSSAELDLEFMNQSDTISFGGL